MDAGTPHHSLPASDVLAGLDAGPDGLDRTEAARRLALTGPNRLPEPPRRRAWRRFLAQFDNVLVQVLLVSAAVTGILQHWVDTGVILAVVLVNAVVGYIQEGRAEQAMGAIRRMLAPRAAILSGGRRLTVDAADLVPGDLVLIEAGEKVPADLRLIAAHGLSVQEAILTGESVPVQKETGPVPAGALLGDRRSMVYSGTLVAAGTGRGVVTATGRDTEIGRIGGLLAGVEEMTTPLIRQIDRFARWLSVLILMIAGLLLLYGTFVARHPFEELFMAVVGLSVAAIPEGLPAVITITLAIGVRAMAGRHAIVRRLPAIEAIGSISVICTDKTGTLTRNEMTVVRAITAEGSFAVAGDGYAPHGRVEPNGQLLGPLAEAARLCNDADLRHTGEGWAVEGDPMEGALLAFAARVAPAGTGWSRRDAIPFDARHRYMAVLHDGPGGPAVHVKGAPERVLMMCRSLWTGDGEGPLDLDLWHRRAEEMAAGGQRVLALAMRRASGRRLADEDLEGGLVLLGLVGLIDPPRPEAVRAVADCRSAGIRVKMITGDHPGTAAAIARMIGLANPHRVLTGADLDALDDAMLAAEVLGTDVFARTSPEHKLRLVEALQAHGLSVAMTGDGVNDAPALKRADVGIAMGLKGSDAAREAAQLVLADDNFATIAAAVREGRTVWDNIIKVISWTLPTSCGEALVVAAALLIGMPLPITPVQILWINLITAITLGLALAFEPGEPDAMARPPRPRSTPLLSRGLIWHIVLVSGLILAAVFGVFAWAGAQGHPPPVARSMAVNMLVVMEIFHLFFIRNMNERSLSLRMLAGTRAVWITVAAVTAAQFAVTYLPPMQALLGTAPVPLLEGVVIVALGAIFFVLLEVEKQVRLALSASD